MKTFYLNSYVTQYKVGWFLKVNEYEHKHHGICFVIISVVDLRNVQHTHWRSNEREEEIDTVAQSLIWFFVFLSTEQLWLLT